MPIHAPQQFSWRRVLDDAMRFDPTNRPLGAARPSSALSGRRRSARALEQPLVTGRYRPALIFEWATARLRGGRQRSVKEWLTALRCDPAIALLQSSFQV